MSFDPDVKSKRSLINAGSKKKLESWKGQRQRERETKKRVVRKQSSHVFLGLTHAKVSWNHAAWISMV